MVQLPVPGGTYPEEAGLASPIPGRCIQHVRVENTGEEERSVVCVAGDTDGLGSEASR